MFIFLKSGKLRYIWYSHVYKEHLFSLYFLKNTLILFSDKIEVQSGYILFENMLLMPSHNLKLS